MEVQGAREDRKKLRNLIKAGVTLLGSSLGNSVHSELSESLTEGLYTWKINPSNSSSEQEKPAESHPELFYSATKCSCLNTFISNCSS